MERALSVRSWGRFALAQRLATEFSSRYATGLSLAQLGRWVLMASAVLLFVLSGLELWRDDRLHTFLLMALGMLLAIGATARVSFRPVALVDAAPAPLPATPLAVSSEILVGLGVPRAVRSGQASELSPQAWGDLMARVSHDMRTPLNAVIGFSDVMTAELFGPVGDDRYRDYIAHIRDSGRELLRSAEDTLAMTSLIAGSGDPAGDTIALDVLTDEAAAVSLVSGLSIDVESGLDVIGERRALRQVLVNLMLEAGRRSKGAGRASLHATTEDEFVIVEVMVSGGTEGARGHEGSLHICMARVLLELAGARLIEIERDGVWRAVTILGRATQTDFFPKPMAHNPLGHGALVGHGKTRDAAMLVN